jgi:cell division protein FtsQ
MKTWIKISLWVLFGGGILALGFLIRDHLNAQRVTKPEIIVHADGENAFITSEEFEERLRGQHLLYEGQTWEQLKTDDIEDFLSKISQVKTVEVFSRINGTWKIDIAMRKPIARIYNKQGESYYLDEDGVPFETIRTHAARVLVFTGEIPDLYGALSVPEIINNDSLKSIRKLDDIYRISNYVCTDPVFHSLIGQVHLKKSGDFVLIPLVGDQKIIFGSAFTEKEVEEKFRKLKVFYEEAIPYEGWNTYSEISLKYRDQIVCKKKKTDE